MNHQLDRLLAAYCAPTLAGIKPASLASCSRAEYPDLPEQLQTYRQAFAARGIQFDILCACRGRFLLLAYHHGQLTRCLSDRRAQHVLAQFGYPAGAPLRVLLDRLRARIAAQQDFPHEIGLFLGYPVEDVRGFIEQRGKGCKLTGDWKVYGDVQAAGRLFRQYDRCRDAARGYIERGMTILELFAA